MTQPALFSYSDLDTDTSAFVAVRANEIKALVKRSAQDIIEIGQKLIEVKQRLPHGSFGLWLEAEFGWSNSLAVKMMNVGERFRSVNFTDLSVAPSALYLLAAPSTPESAVEEAVTQAQNGTPITHQEAKTIVGRHKDEVTREFPCPDCGEILSYKGWHCPHCDCHWGAERRDCPNCHNKKSTKGEVEAIFEMRRVAPDLADEVRQGKKNIPWARRVLAERQSQERARERQANGAAPATTAPRVRLIVGDAARLELPDESVDVIITSPPYNLGDDDWPMGGHGRREGGIGYEDAMPGDMYERWQLCVLGELFRVAKPGASLFYNHKTRTRNGALLHPMTWLSRVQGWTIRQEIIWDREVTHNHSASLFWPVDERIYWLTKGKPSLYGGAVGMPTVWRFHGPQPYTWHPAPFSEDLPRRCLRAIGGENLVVLDPFAGSCTAVKVAAEMGHEGIGVDSNGAYLARAREEYGW